ncbi:MAG TPA: hypothetical protein VFV51_16180 [Vicinamibacterales bacterium]|nr:hypothetical protein [Vicinamibacterales bacterium]
MKLPHITIAVVLALAIICTVVAVSLLDYPGNWLLAIWGSVLPLVMILRMWQPPLRPAFARMVRK